MSGALRVGIIGVGWGALVHGPAYQFRDPDGHRFEIFFEQDRYVPPDRAE